ncbi:MAG: HAD hydrolase family protein [Planctomycetota bacterium]
MTRKYDLLAVDIDGTLADSTGRVPPENAEAIQRAKAAGIEVVLCTGRSRAESGFAIEAIGPTRAMVSAGGSMVVDPGSGATMHRFAMHEPVVRGVVDLLTDEGHAALVLKDGDVSPVDYLVVTQNGATIDPVTTWWFETLGVSYTEVGSLDEDEHPEWTVRVGACAPSTRTIPIRDDLLGRYGEHVLFHSFPAVVAPEHVKNDGSGGMYHVVEAFDREAHKWSGIAWLCERFGIDPKRTAAIGDQINDITMIENAGLGVAMGNAVDEIASIADAHTATNNEFGVALAIDRILAGEW